MKDTKIKYRKSRSSTLKQYCDKNLGFSYLLDEYDIDNNQEMPNTISCSNNNKVFWICQKCHHKWTSTIRNRLTGHGCPSCRVSPQTSFSKKILYYYIKKVFPDAVHNYNPKFLNGKEVDVFIPSISLAIEYDGQRWHQDAERDKLKDDLCANNKILLLRIREYGCPMYKSSSVKFDTEKTSDYYDLIKTIKKVFDYININVSPCNYTDFDLDRDYAEIKELFNRTIQEKSLAKLYPDIAVEWHPVKNKSKTPLLVAAGSNEKAWWIGKCGHEWETRISHRTSSKSNCPYCSNQRLLVGFNDLETVHPEIAKEWHPEKNEKIKPSDVLVGSYHKYWWRCEHGHEWKASVKSRYHNNKYLGCPFCSGHRVWKGFNDIGTTHPNLLDEWDYSRNEKSPFEVSKGSYYNAWWIGKECGHNYQMQVLVKVNRGNCPYCSNRRILSGFNDLATKRPELLSFFDYKKNIAKPNEVATNTTKILWWKCAEGHSFQKSGKEMVKSKVCPICKEMNTK